MSEWSGNKWITPAGDLAELRAQVSELEKNAEHMRRQRDQARDELSRLKVQCFEEIIPELRAQVAELWEVLKPFSDVDGEGDKDFPDGTAGFIKFGRSICHGITLGDFRRARAALEMSGGVK